MKAVLDLLDQDEAIVRCSLNPTDDLDDARFAGTEVEEGFVKQTPLGRAGQPDDIATVVKFLASEDAKWITGQTLESAGGF